MKKIILSVSLLLAIAGFVLNTTQSINVESSQYIAGEEDIDIILG